MKYEIERKTLPFISERDWRTFSYEFMPLNNQVGCDVTKITQAVVDQMGILPTLAYLWRAPHHTAVVKFRPAIMRVILDQMFGNLAEFVEVELFDKSSELVFKVDPLNIGDNELAINNLARLVGRRHAMDYGIDLSKKGKDCPSKYHCDGCGSSSLRRVLNAD